MGDVSSVTYMSVMFYKATKFNSDVSNWDVSSVIDMVDMFNKASEFNSDVSNWDVSSVTDMYKMFYKATKFNSKICKWNLDGKVTTKMLTGSLCSKKSCITCGKGEKLV